MLTDNLGILGKEYGVEKMEAVKCLETTHLLTGMNTLEEEPHSCHSCNGRPCVGSAPRQGGRQ